MNAGIVKIKDDFAALTRKGRNYEKNILARGSIILSVYLRDALDTTRTRGKDMIVRKEYIERPRHSIYAWHITKYLLFGFIPIYISKIRISA